MRTRLQNFAVAPTSEPGPPPSQLSQPLGDVRGQAVRRGLGRDPATPLCRRLLGWGTTVSIFKHSVTFNNGLKWTVVLAQRGFLLSFTLACQVSMSQQR